jgi:hypothetical protein
MSFFIEITGKNLEDFDQRPSYWGRIKIGDFSERFILPIAWWSCEEYEQQWQEGLERIHYTNTSCLITSVELSNRSPLVNRWVLYKEQDIVYVQNELLFGKFYKETFNDEPFNLETCYNHIEPRMLKDANGEGPSEWSFNIKDLKVSKALS